MTIADVDPESAVGALDQRLRAASTVLLGRGRDPRPSAPGRVGALLLPELIAACQRSGSRQDLWLLMTALGGAMPGEEDLRDASRHMALGTDREVQTRLLDIAFELASDSDGAYELDIVRDAVVVDVDFCARRDFHTGIQRVVRETVPRWDEAHEILPVAWTDSYTALRRLHPWEVPNVMAYQPGGGSSAKRTDQGVTRLVVPLGSSIILPEIPEPEASDCYAALAQWTDNRIVAIGYDMIPIVSADLRPGFEATRFARYLNVVKHADHIAAISRSATTEFAGFSQALGAQGLAGPLVTEVLLPASPPDRGVQAAAGPADDARPVVVCVGTHDPHKNHAVLVQAAERLWREKVDFELVFIGGVGFMGPENMCFTPLLKAGRPVRNLGRVSDEEMANTLRSASFTVFLSLHEGYGLPVAESLACGTPVITSNFGSLQEIAEGGGCVTVDPRDDDAVTAAMRTLLTDPQRRRALRDEIAAREERTWQGYADELWEASMSGVVSA
ncbi:glycosyltransferase family 4 protein [Cellulomonas sp.]|uniref:glycosyltransferase family 4 protein n=1 Tax=Cellulomonas sp. TaxID=40001 RepID=UPI003BA98B32